MPLFTLLGTDSPIGRRLACELRGQGHEVQTPGADAAPGGHPALGHVVFALPPTDDPAPGSSASGPPPLERLAGLLQGARFESLLYVSSTCVYGDGDRADEEAPLPPEPSDAGRLAWLIGESMCLATQAPTVRVVRVAQVVSAEADAGDGWLAQLSREATHGRLLLRSSLHSARDYVHIDDVVRMLPAIAMRGRHRLYNLASGRQTTHAEWAERLVRRYGCRVEVVADAPVQRMAPIDITRLREEFGFTPWPALEVLPLPAADRWMRAAVEARPPVVHLSPHERPPHSRSLQAACSAYTR